jgi:hypothetical protein
MEILLLLLIVPVCWPVVSRYLFGNEITPQEVLIQMGATCVFVAGAWFAGQYGALHDIEIWNGSVTNKDQVYVSCEHSYQCNCITTCSGDPSVCTTICQTCYDHSNDWDWRVYTTVGELNIARIDRRGSDTPPRWSAVQLGEPASLPHDYVNYIKAVPDSLFGKRNLDLTRYTIPSYPQVYDYYRYNRVLNGGAVDGTFVSDLNTKLNAELKTLGGAKEVNIIVVFTKSDPSYAYALESSWIGGKKNDVIVVVGAPSPPEIEWVDVITLGLNSGNELLGITLSDTLTGMTLDNADEFGYNIVSAVGEHFDRKAMKDFEYLKDDIEPPTWLLILIIVISLLLSGGLTIYFKNN